MDNYKKHVLICTGPRCAPGVSNELYTWFKERLKAEKLTEPPYSIKRTQCNCFGICQGGPIVVVYPEGVWYEGVTRERMERILEEHLKGGRPVEEWVFHRYKG